ncbi:MAG: polysaccharide biosynthesis protein [Eubacteriales bacterium]|nr:polysaccharide biosynthesis protein [Eubacteriales bacterium]
MSKKSLVTSTAVLAAAGLIVKILGAFFRIPLTNWIGAVGMANYAPAYAIYSVLLVISTAGLPVATSKMVSERYAVGQFREADRVFRISKILMTTLGLMGAIVVIFGAGTIAEMVHVPGSALAMQATAPALLVVPLMSAYRGYFQGQQNMNPTAVSQIMEQLFRVGIGLSLGYLMMNGSLFADQYDSGARGAAGGCFGASAGALAGLATVLVIFALNKKFIRARIRSDKTGVHEVSGKIIKTLIIIAIPITIGAALLPLMNAIDASVVMYRLQATGWETKAAEDLYGQLTSMADPIIGFPQVFMQAIIVSIVPMVSAANRLNDLRELRNTISLGLRMTTLIALPCTIGLLILAKPTLLLLYPFQVESAISATPCLRVLSIGFVFLGLVTTMTGVLQGMTKQNWPVVNLAIGIAVKIIVTWALVGIHDINIVGAAIGTLCAYLTAATLDYICVVRFSGARIPVKAAIVKPLTSSLVMGVFVFASYKLFMLTGHNSIATLLAICVGAVVYGIMIIKTKGINRDEMLGIKFGSKLVVICDKLRLW